MARYDTFREELVCDCGHKTKDYFYSELKGDLSLYNNEIEDTKIIFCEKCNRKYSINLGLQIEVSVDLNDTQLRSFIYKDKDDRDFSSSLLDDLLIGDRVNLHDGEYRTLDKLYVIENERVDRIHSSETDENQLELFVYENMRRKEFEHENG